MKLAAACLNMNAASPYPHFKSKHPFLAVVLDQFHVEVELMMQQLELVADPHERFYKLFQQYVKIVKSIGTGFFDVRKILPNDG